MSWIPPRMQRPTKASGFHAEHELLMAIQTGAAMAA